MYQILVSRLKHRIRSNLGILLGVTLFVAVAVCHPAFLYGSLNYLLAMQWQQIIKEENVYPAALSRTGASEVKSALEARTLIKKQEEYLEKWSRYLELPFINNQQNYTLAGETAKGSYQGNSSYYQLGYMPNLENHIKVVKGNTLAEAENSESEGLLTGAGREGKLIPCIISTRTMDEGNLVCGEVLTFPRLTDNRGKSLKFKIAGIFEERDTHDIFWKNTTSDYVQQIFLSDKDFFSLADLEGSKEVKFVLNGMLDYKKIKAQNVKEVQETIAAFESVDSSFSYNFGDTLNTYKKQCETLSVLLWVLELPCLLLLLSFLFMLSGFRIKSEAEEISMLKSRGYSRWAVVRLYMSEGGVTTFAGILIGIPLGLLFCKLAASTDSFLSFSSQDTSMYKPVWQMLIFGIMAGLLAVVILTVPAWIYSRKSIVEHNSIDIRKSPNPIWQQLFLDVILVVGTCYLLHNYNQQKEQLAAKVISGESLDPMIFVNVFLFLMGIGLFTLRLTSYLVRGIFFVLKDKLSPQFFAAFLQIIRTYRKQGMISIFLVLTIGMGVLNASLARTINQNGKERISNDIGSDYVLEQAWPVSLVRHMTELKWYYKEPDYAKIKKAFEGKISHMTRVIRDDNGVIYTNFGAFSNCLLMGISTKEFGECAELKEGLNDRHWYYSLNELAKKTNGVIISSNLADKYGYRVGDTLTYSRYSPIDEDETIAQISSEIVDIVDAFPGYQAYRYEKVKDGDKIKINEKEQYLIVNNYAFMVNAFGLTPYEIWMKQNNGTDAEMIRNTLNEEKIEVLNIESKEELLMQHLRSPMVQITNGMYTLGFLISLILCFVGFFIYWLRSIRQRQELFGIYRAMGMRYGEINQMLFTEQIFSSFFAVLSGLTAGIVSSSLFVTLIALVYLPEKHSIPLTMYSSCWDFARLLLFLTVMCAMCFFMMKRTVKKMKINESLKLGEDG